MEGSLPSELKREYPWLEIDGLAEYYERGEGLTGEFIESWESMRRFYKEEMNLYLGDEISDLMVNFITAMKAEGYNCLLRAGQSLSSLILSPSKKHGNLNSLYVVFAPRYDSDKKMQEIPTMELRYHVNGKDVTQFEEEIALTNRIRKVLNHLSQQPIQ